MKNNRKEGWEDNGKKSEEEENEEIEVLEIEEEEERKIEENGYGKGKCWKDGNGKSVEVMEVGKIVRNKEWELLRRKKVEEEGCGRKGRILRVEESGKGIRMVLMDDIEIRNGKERIRGKKDKNKVILGWDEIVKLMRIVNEKKNFVGIKVEEKVNGEGDKKRDNNEEEEEKKIENNNENKSNEGDKNGSFSNINKWRYKNMEIESKKVLKGKNLWIYDGYEKD